jgi:hypothetical protein
LRKRSKAFGAINHRSRPLYAALCEIGDECRLLGLPPLPALVVRADTRRPGEAYFEGEFARTAHPSAKIAAWWNDLKAVRGTTYPPR